MAALDAISLAQRVIKLGLVTPAQLQECQDEVGEVSLNPEPLLRSLERKAYLTALQIDKLLKGDTEGYFLGPYRLLYKIASGSFGRVFRGDDPQSGRVVAIKVLRRRWSEDPQSVELFEREGRVGMSLRHDNIVEILHIGRDLKTKQYYFVMEFVEGGNLRDLLAIRKKFEPPEALKLMEEMASALAYAYARGVTHRDIKLTNILISSTGISKLVDFGLAQIYATTKGYRFGLAQDDEDMHVQRTVDYAGLEKATGVQTGDVRSDIYFLGCVLYEMLTGRPPLLMTKDKMARMRKDRFENVPPIAPGEINGPASIVRLVENMMSLDPARRYQTPNHLLEAIKAARGDLAGTMGSLLSRTATPTVFLLEKDDRLQEAIREKLKKLGYRVLLAATPARAVERFNSHPFQGLVVDVGTTGDEGLMAFKHIMDQADIRKRPCAGVLILSENQADLATQTLLMYKNTVILNRPLKLGDLVRTLDELVPLPKEEKERV
jgi:serine/threonine protein kinase